ncbi:WASH complex subunit 4 [Nymphon striatum]|nr:WASH complex subunit 4 [Nymphon striatum]
MGQIEGDQQGPLVNFTALFSSGSGSFQVLKWIGDQIVGEVQLRKYGKFMEDYVSQLQAIEEALDDSMGDLWDTNLDPISLQLLPYEQTTIMHLVTTENKILNKVIMVLSSLCCEMDRLCHEAETKYYDAFLFYGEGEPSDGLQEGDAQIYIGRMFPIFNQLSCFVTRCYEVVKNSMQQLASLYISLKGGVTVMSVTDVHFHTFYVQLGELLKCLITLDEIFVNQNAIKEHWTLYKRMVKSIKHDPQRFNVDANKLRPFDVLISQLETKLFDKGIFTGCVEQIFDDGKAFVSKNSAFADEFAVNIRIYLNALEVKLGDSNEMEYRYKLVGLCALFVLHVKIFCTADKKIFRSLWELHKKIPAVNLHSNVLWFIDQFLLQNVPNVDKFIDKRAASAVRNSRLTYLQTKNQFLVREAQNLHIQVLAWAIDLESNLNDSGSMVNSLNRRCSVFIQGLSLAWNINHMVRTVMNLHVYLEKPMTKTAVLSLCKLIETLKLIESVYHKHTLKITENINNILQYLSYIALTTITIVKKRVTTDKKYSTQALDVLSALVMIEKALSGPGTKERLLIARLGLAMTTQLKCFKDEEYEKFQNNLKKIETICYLRKKLKVACDSGFLYWHRVVFPIYFKDYYESNSDAHRIHYMFAALRDCVAPMMRTKHESDPQILLSAFDNEISEYLKQNFLDCLCRDIETDLRLHIHLHLQLEDRNPFKVGLKDLCQFLNIRPIRFFDRFINVKVYVEHYLDKTFYNLTTVALDNWKTYDAMRNLAMQKYDLHTVDAHLPCRTLEQIFVERSSNNKHLNTINIKHIANSIRTHGTGIMNTTVNFTYQFLRKKFYIFSQFLYDEHIKSRLIKDIRYYKENKAQFNQKYPYERAEKFNKGIRKLGLTGDGQSYLDQFRILISQIGNAMGYIRMIRSGGLHCCSNAIRFIPDLEDIVSFQELSKEENLSPECQQASLLVDVFATVFRDSKNKHLRNVYVILPPLTLNFVDHSITCKEKMNRKNKIGAAFTDDGFAMAYGEAIDPNLANMELDPNPIALAAVGIYSVVCRYIIVKTILTLVLPVKLKPTFSQVSPVEKNQ